ncbi:Uncharacterized protein APZ42_005059 [Daphnia magna]|uniref:Uncharacterized protein n=1 Tax=Daphnia magna TaxID=35525 RepID=A0A0P5WQI5_9CRUS|nr:Uncharacterized protein APZ42_005059 [Daphnia magna]
MSLSKRNFSPQSQPDTCTGYNRQHYTSSFFPSHILRYSKTDALSFSFASFFPFLIQFFSCFFGVVKYLMSRLRPQSPKH